MPETSLVKELVTNVAVAALILVVGLWLAKRIKNLLTRLMEKRGVDSMQAPFVKFNCSNRNLKR